MKLHFAGSDGSEKYNQVIHESGGENRLESFYTLGKKPPSKGFHLLLDSGGFVARIKGKIVRVAELANYINRYDVKYCFNLDTNDVEETLSNQKYLEEHTKAYILPVYHYSDYAHPSYRDLLLDYIAKYEYVSIGGVANVFLPEKKLIEYLNFVFHNTRDKTRIHGLGITDQYYLEKYPFYSVDSTSWLSAARFGNTKVTDCDIMTLYRAKKKKYMDNTRDECLYWLQVQNYMTELWERRGVIWK